MLNRVLKCASTARVTGRWRLNNLILRSSENDLETIVPSLISRLIFFFHTWERSWGTINQEVSFNNT